MSNPDGNLLASLQTAGACCLTATTVSMAELHHATRQETFWACVPICRPAGAWLTATTVSISTSAVCRRSGVTRCGL